MKAACIVLLSGVLSAQVASIGLKTETERPEDRSQSHLPHLSRTTLASAPIAGYMLGPGPAEIHSILTASRKVKVGDLVAVPSATRRLYLPPRQQYALAEQNSNEPVAVWALHKTTTTGAAQDLIPISGAIAHPDLVVFSPRGESLLLYSQASASLQVVSHLPAEPTLMKSLPLPLGGFPIMAVSDDGAVVVASSADGSMVHSLNGPTWTRLQTTVTPQAWSFIPKTHDLAIVDAMQKTLLLFSNVDSKSGTAYRVLAQDVQADRLMATRGGEQLVASNFSHSQVWTIDLKTNALLQNEKVANASDLFSLRDGYTFLLSSPQGLSALRLAAPQLNTEVNR